VVAAESDLVLGLDLSDAAWWLRGDVRYDPTQPDSTTNRRGDLRTAGVTRGELFERSASRLPIRAHDLMATFVTIAPASGKTEPWVTGRTGHKSSQMLALYTRQARTWAEQGLGGPEPLDELLPETALREQVHPRTGRIGHPMGIVRSHPRELNPRPTVYETGGIRGKCAAPLPEHAEGLRHSVDRHRERA
jgi:hypothetical protein